ncbi:homeobox protein Hox-D12a [Nothobranchius furzeri]|uniref:Homeobox D12 n=1 Tax=Nothobranchius furzeri TaxID=105023 RepID=A0A8C6PXC2_NOTFU|nr:homeobox protein Hox-D12a [Nothobranchius furzeri]KAF7215823.1 homeobox D12 [Nothobranchius furzeri]
MEMCERNPLNAGYVGSLLNFAPPDSLYFPNLCGNGAHIPGLHQLPCNRREVCTHPWTAPSSCASAAPPAQNRAFGGFCPPLVPNSLSVNCSRGHVKTHLEENEARCFQDSSQKAEGSDGQDEPYASEQGLRGYSELDRGLHGSGTRDSDSGLLNGTKQELDETSSSRECSRATFGQGAPWCSSQVRTRKKRKPYTKSQLAELENEFLMNEFINRQKRKELSDRLDLSDQQVKIWFQNRRMKKKRLMMREQAFITYG